MKLWAKNRLIPAQVAVTILAMLLITPSSGILVSLPNLTGGPGLTSPLSALLPLVPMILYVHGLTRQNLALESLAARQVWWLDLAAVGLLLLIFAFPVILNADPDSLAALRNLAGFLGVALISSWAFNLATAALPPTIWVIAALMGLRAGDPLITAWQLEPGDKPSSWLTPISLLFLGAIAYLKHSDRALGR